MLKLADGDAEVRVRRVDLGFEVPEILFAFGQSVAETRPGRLDSRRPGQNAAGRLFATVDL